MLNPESFEKHLFALLEALLEAAVAELRRLLVTESWRSGASALERSAAAEAGGEDREDRRRDVAHITDEFIKLMKACNKDILEKTTRMVKATVCEVRPEGGMNSEHRGKATKRGRGLKGFRPAVEDHLYCKEELRRKESIEAAPLSESAIEPASCAEMASELSPAPDAAPLSPAPDAAEDNSVQEEPKSLNAPRKKAKSFQCPSCEKTFTKKCLMERHNLRHTKPHSCPQCGKRFATLRLMIPHTRKHTGEKPYGCPECGIRFAYKSTFNRHMRSHTAAEGNGITNVCPLCERQFQSVFFFQRHRCSALHRTFTCAICPETFECRRSLADHENLHAGSRDFVCEMCGETFLSSSSLVTHRAVHFPGGNCCGKSDRCGVGGDIRSDSAAKKLFSCDVCGKEVSHQSALKHHMLKHTGEKVYVCGTCGKRCAHGSALQNHLRVHTGKKTGETPACSACGKTFASVRNLRRHMTVHTGEKPHICSHCGKAFGDASNLKNHALIHCSVRRFECHVCGRKFAQRSGLIGHRQLHVGQTFECKICGKKFVLKAHLSRHEREHLVEETKDDGQTQKRIYDQT